MTRWDLLPIVALFATASLLAGQTPQQRGSIAGVVRDAATRRPVAGALVSAAGRVSPPSTLSDASGRFAFENLAAGNYSVSAQKGLARGAYGRHWVGGDFASLAVMTDQRQDIEILLWSAASIAGTVYDERNTPAPDVTVRAVRVDDGATERLFVESSPSDRTDDRGAFALDNLRPGRYAVCVLIRHRTTRDFETLELLARTLRDPGGELLVFSGEPGPPPPDTGGRPQTYVTTCAPSAATSNESAEVALQLGEERAGVDIRMRTDRRFTVSGRIIQPSDPFDDIDLSLSPVDRMFAYADVGPRSEARGDRFLFMSVPPGEYILKARRSVGHSDTVTPDPRGLSFERKLTVGDEDVQDLVVDMRPGATISGRYVCEGDTPATCWRSAPSIAGQRFLGSGIVTDDGRFTIIVPTGSHRLQLDSLSLAPGWRLKSISLAGGDVTSAPLEVSEASVADVAVSLTRQRTSVRGTVREGLTPPRDVVVVAYPEDTALWQRPIGFEQFFRTVSATGDGRYEILDLPAGSFLVAAVGGLQLNEWPGQATLQSLRRSATRVQVAFGQPVTVDLRVGSR